jgi:hypothetical protein
LTAIHRIYTVFVITISDLTYNYGTHDSSELDSIYDLRDTLAKVPLDLQDTQAATEVIRILGSELLYSTHVTHLICSQGYQLCNMLSAIRLLREFTLDEMHIIYGLAMRRQERLVIYVSVVVMTDSIQL